MCGGWPDNDNKTKEENDKRGFYWLVCGGSLSWEVQITEVGGAGHGNEACLQDPPIVSDQGINMWGTRQAQHYLSDRDKYVLYIYISFTGSHLSFSSLQVSKVSSVIDGEFRFSCINIIIITGELVKLERTRAPANTTTAGQRPEPELSGV